MTRQVASTVVRTRQEIASATAVFRHMLDGIVMSVEYFDPSTFLNVRSGALGSRCQVETAA
jgi:hypothetical protein